MAHESGPSLRTFCVSLILARGEREKSLHSHPSPFHSNSLLIIILVIQKKDRNTPRRLSPRIVCAASTKSVKKSEPLFREL